MYSNLLAKENEIQTEEDLILQKELEDKYDMKIIYPTITRENQKCDAPAFEVDTIDCLIVNFGKIMIDKPNFYISSNFNRKINIDNNLKREVLNQIYNVNNYYVNSLHIDNNYKDNERRNELRKQINEMLKKESSNEEYIKLKEEESKLDEKQKSLYLNINSNKDKKLNLDIYLEPVGEDKYRILSATAILD